MPKVYIIRGSEDGNIAVYTNAKGAVEKAIEYANGDTKPCVQNKTQLLTYLRKHNVCTANRKDSFIECDVEAFWLER